MATKNITLSVDEELLRRARILAAERGTSVSALVSELLTQAVGQVDDYDEVWARELRIMREGLYEMGGRRPTRAELHQR